MLQDNLLFEDIVWAIQEGIARSYSQLHFELRVYGARRLTDAVNRLLEEGYIGADEHGFVFVSAESRSNGKVKVEPSSVPVLASADSVRQASGGSKVNEIGLPEAAKELPDEKTFDRSIFPMLPKPSRGTVLATTPVSLLGLDDSVGKLMAGFDVDTVRDLVRRLTELNSLDGKTELASLIFRLVCFAGVPSVNLQGEDIRYLSILSGSRLFYFDIFGTLCTTIDQEMGPEEIQGLLLDQSFNPVIEGDFSLEQFSNNFKENSIQADDQLYKQLVERGYPVDDQTFHVIMLPSIEEMLEESSYETPKNLVHDFLKGITKGKHIENACLGKLRDDSYRFALCEDSGPKSYEVLVPGEIGFINAAKRLCDAVPSFRFNEDDLTLRWMRSAD